MKPLRILSFIAVAAAAMSTAHPKQASACTYRDCINQIDECVYDFGLPPESCGGAYDICVTLCSPS